MKSNVYVYFTDYAVSIEFKIKHSNVLDGLLKNLKRLSAVSM